MKNPIVPILNTSPFKGGMEYGISQSRDIGYQHIGIDSP